MLLELKEKINCLLNQEGKKQVYLDVSGSMPHRKQIIDFLHDKKDIELFGFDEKIYHPLKGGSFYCYGGGTSFSPIRDAVESNPQHPEIIIVITDGYADFYHKLKKPNRWHFLIINNSPFYLVKLPENSHRHIICTK